MGNHSGGPTGLSAQSFLLSSPLHDSLQPVSCCTSHSADMADASPSPERSPSRLSWHNKALLRFLLLSARLHITNLLETKQPTKVDSLITPGAHVCLPRKGGDASSWNEKTEKPIQKDIQTNPFAPFCFLLFFIGTRRYKIKCNIRTISRELSKVFQYGLWPAAVEKLCWLASAIPQSEWVYVSLILFVPLEGGLLGAGIRFSSGLGAESAVAGAGSLLTGASYT